MRMVLLAPTPRGHRLVCAEIPNPYENTPACRNTLWLSARHIVEQTRRDYGKGDVTIMYRLLKNYAQEMTAMA